VSAVRGGWYHVAALLQSDSVICWGSNGSNQGRVPPDLSQVVDISCGAYHPVAVTKEGNVVFGDQVVTDSALCLLISKT
jgi:alpha-tubulin suppressor-like RCC1 family protein